MQIAIDGPGGAGKSTIAKTVAASKGFIYVDTGALYRAIGNYALQNEVNTKDGAAVAALLPNISIELCYVDGEQRVMLNNEDVTALLRSEPVSMAASDVSAHPPVREFLLKLQRDIARKNDVIMDGRDIGTVILPQADVKIFLTADSAERAKRRVLQLAQKGVQADFDSVHADIIERDRQDSERATAPLKAAPDSVLLDTTDMNFEQSLATVAELIDRASK